MVGEREVGFMRLALAAATQALHAGEVPVGCVLVLPASGDTPDEVVATGANRTNVTLNATRHAELEAIDQVLSPAAGAAAQERAGEGQIACEGDATTVPAQSARAAALDRLRRCELYVTVEPCIMCAAALAEAGVSRVFFGCHNERFGGCGSVLHLHEEHVPSGAAAPARYACVPGVLADEAVALLREFYSRGNAKAPKPQRPVCAGAPGAASGERKRGAKTKRRRQKAAASE